LRHSRFYVESRLFFRGVFQKRDLSNKDKTMVFETYCMDMTYSKSQTPLFYLYYLNLVFEKLLLFNSCYLTLNSCYITMPK